MLDDLRRDLAFPAPTQRLVSGGARSRAAGRFPPGKQYSFKKTWPETLKSIVQQGKST